jgi:hypothetical protein
MLNLLRSTNQKKESINIYIPVKPMHDIKELCNKNGDTFIGKKSICCIILMKVENITYALMLQDPFQWPFSSTHTPFL